MEKKRPFVILALVMFSFAAIALLNTSLTGFTVYGKLSSIFSGNALSTMGPTLILATIFAISVVALKRIASD